jgi:hypothetical protein
MLDLLYSLYVDVQQAIKSWSELLWQDVADQVTLIVFHDNVPLKLLTTNR